MAALISHGPLCHRLEGDLVIYFCDCGWTTPPHYTIEGALQALGEHVADPGGGE